MASFHQAIREFGALTKRRFAQPLDGRDEARFQALLAFFEQATGDELPPDAEAAPPDVAPVPVLEALPESTIDVDEVTPAPGIERLTASVDAAGVETSVDVAGGELPGPKPSSDEDDIDVSLAEDEPAAPVTEGPAAVDIDVMEEPVPSLAAAAPAPLVLSRSAFSTIDDDEKTPEANAFPAGLLALAAFPVPPVSNEPPQGAAPPEASAPVPPAAALAEEEEPVIALADEVPEPLAAAAAELGPAQAAVGLEPFAAEEVPEAALVEDTPPPETPMGSDEDHPVVAVDELAAQVAQPEPVEDELNIAIAEEEPEPVAGVAAAPVGEEPAIDVEPVIALSEEEPVALAPVEPETSQSETVPALRPISLARPADEPSVAPDAAPAAVAHESELSFVEATPGPMAAEPLPQAEPALGAAVAVDVVASGVEVDIEEPAAAVGVVDASSDAWLEAPIASPAPVDPIGQIEVGPEVMADASLFLTALPEEADPRAASADPAAEPAPQEGATVRLDASEVARMLSAAAAASRVAVPAEAAAAEWAAPPVLADAPPADAWAGLPVLVDASPAEEWSGGNAADSPFPGLPPMAALPESEQSTMVRPALSLGVPTARPAADVDDDELLAFARGEVGLPPAPAAVPGSEWSDSAAWAQQPAQAEAPPDPAWTAEPTGWQEPGPAPADAWSAAPAPAWTTPAPVAEEWGAPAAPAPAWNAPAAQDWSALPAAPAAPAWNAPAAQDWSAPAAAAPSGGTPDWMTPIADTVNGVPGHDEAAPAPDDGPPMELASASEFLAHAAAANNWEAPQAASWQQPAPTAAWGDAAPAWNALPEPAAAAWGAPAPEPSLVLPGEHRVVVHTLEGGVKRGLAANVDLAGESVGLAQGPGQPPLDFVPFSRTKAVFFMLQPGEKPQVATGRRVKVTFVDGRQVEGILGEEIGQGFFLLPTEARTSTARVYVLSHAVRSVV